MSAVSGTRILWSRRLWLGLCGLGVLFAGFVICGVYLDRAGYVDLVVDMVRTQLEPPPGEEGDVAQVAYKRMLTTLHHVEYATFPIGSFTGSGGAIAEFAGHLLFATPSGLIGAVVDGARRDGPYRISYLPDKVPMRLDLKGVNVFYKDPLFNPELVRVADILVDPVSATEADLYVSHHQLEKSCIAFVISRLRLAGGPDGVHAVTGQWEEIYRARPCIPPKEEGAPFAGSQIGGRMVKTSPTTLLLAVGDQEFDGVNDPVMAPMEDDYDYGKILEIDLATRTSRILARGLRNPQGLVRASDGTVWETEHGPRGGDEVNLIERGRNYGWPRVTLGVLYGFPTRPWPPNPVQGRHDGFQKPKFAFVPSIATSSIVETDSDEFPLWKGDLLVATLRDNTLYRLRRSGNDVLYAEPLGSLHHRLRDCIALSDGRIAMLTDSADIILLRRNDGSEPSPPFQVAGYTQVRAVAAARRQEVGTMPGDARPDYGRNIFNAHCGHCHSLRPESGIGPHLVGVVGRTIGATGGFEYSDALSHRMDRWTKEKLVDFLADPERHFEGTAMPKVELQHPMYRQVVDFLATVH